MSRPSYLVEIDGELRKVRLDDNPFEKPYQTPYVDPENGYIRVLWKDGLKRNLHLSELRRINSLAFAMLKDRGYDLDGVRVSFMSLPFYGDPDPQLTISKALDDEYRWDPEPSNDLVGTLRRVRPQ